MNGSELVRRARRAARLTQRGLAARSRVPQSAIARLERGRASPRFDTVDRLLRACGKGLELVDRPGVGVDRSLIVERLAWSPRERVLATARQWERTRVFTSAR